MPDQTRHGVPVVNTDIQIPEKNQAVRWSTLQFINKTERLSFCLVANSESGH